MSDWTYESGSGRSSHPGCNEYVVETNDDYVASDGEVRRKTTWDCPVHGEIVEDEKYPILDKDDASFVWGAFLAAKQAGVVPQDVERPKGFI